MTGDEKGNRAHEEEEDEIPGELKAPDGVVPSFQAEPQKSRDENAQKRQPPAKVKSKQPEEENETTDEHERAEPDQGPEVVIGQDARCHEDEIRNKHSILVVERPQVTERELPVESCVDQGNDRPVILVGCVDGVVSYEEQVGGRDCH